MIFCGQNLSVEKIFLWWPGSSCRSFGRWSEKANNPLRAAPVVVQNSDPDDPMINPKSVQRICFKILPRKRCQIVQLCHIASYVYDRCAIFLCLTEIIKVENPNGNNKNLIYGLHWYCTSDLQQLRIVLFEEPCYPACLGCALDNNGEAN